MKKMTLALVAVLTVTASHAAFAGSSLQKQRIAQDNYEYFRAQGVKDSGQAVAQNPDYIHLATPAQRTAARSVAYFKDKPSSGNVAAGANKADYDFAVTPAQRSAKRNYEYFSKK